MNYFELYEMQEHFVPDTVAVKRKYYELSRQYHPDRYAQADAATRQEALRMAALNNDAYKTLTNIDRTMAYILKLHGMLEDEEKYTLPPDFLMEMMELNEAVSDYEDAPDNEQIKQQAIQALKEQLQTWDKEVAILTEKYENTHDTILLKEIKDYYFRKKYLLRIQERIDSFAARS